MEFPDVPLKLTPRGLWLNSQSSVLASPPQPRGGLFLPGQLELPSPVCQE